ncbi:MAG: DegT/DnrJ/EryC1/StrS family aminotransferase [Egibacteraceae bacterium]
MRVLASGILTQGREVGAFEEEFSLLVEGRHCVAVGSGTSALHLGMAAAGIGRGDEVIVPSFSFAATANAVRWCGATPVFADIEPSSFCLDVGATAAAVTPRTAALMPVHLYGHPADMAGFTDLARSKGLLLAEDAAQAHGARLDGRPAGALGEVAAFSFYPTKNMTTGEGGMIVTASAEIARTARLLRNQGMERRYVHEIVGYNARMTDLAAAIGRVQLERLTGWNAARRATAQRYDAALQGVVTPRAAPRVDHAYHQYTIRSADRDRLRGRLRARGIGCEVYYRVPIHRQRAYSLDGLGADLPETDRAAAEVLSIPIHPGLSDAEVEAVISAVNGS